MVGGAKRKRIDVADVEEALEVELEEELEEEEEEEEEEKEKEGNEEEKPVLTKTYDITAWKEEIAKHKRSSRQTTTRRRKNDDDDDGALGGTSARSDTTRAELAIADNTDKSGGGGENAINDGTHENKRFLLRVPLWAQKSALAQSAVSKAFKRETIISTSDDEKDQREEASPVPPSAATGGGGASKASSFEQALRANRATQARAKEMLESIAALIERDALKIEEIKELWQSRKHQQTHSEDEEEEEEEEEKAKEEQENNFATADASSSLADGDGGGGNSDGKNAFSRQRPRRRNDDCDEELEAIANNVGKILRRKMGRPPSKKSNKDNISATDNDEINNHWSSPSASAYFQVVGIASELENDDDDKLSPKALLPNDINNGNNDSAFARNVERKIPLHFNDASSNGFKPWSEKDDLALTEGVRLYLLEKRRLRKQVDLEELAGEKIIPVEDILTDVSRGWQSVWENCSSRRSSSTTTPTSIDDWSAVRNLCVFKKKTGADDGNNKEREEDDDDDVDHNKLALSRTPDDLRLRWIHAVDPRIASTIDSSSEKKTATSSSNAALWSEEEDTFLASLVEEDALEEETGGLIEKRKWFRVANNLNVHMKQRSRSGTTKQGDDVDDDAGEEKKEENLRRQLLLRSPFQCLHRYQTILNKNITRSKWTSEDDCALQTFVQECGQARWNECARFLPEYGHTATQCKHRFLKLMQNNSEKEYKKGKWTKEEDEELKAIVLGEQKDGEEEDEEDQEEEREKEKKYTNAESNVIPWSLVAKKMSTNRRDKQCRERWTNILQPSLLNEQFGTATGMKRKFTPKEDAMLLVLHANFIDKKERRKDWSVFESTEVLPGRSVKQCKQRVATLLKKKKEVEIRERLEREITKEKNKGSGMQRLVFWLQQPSK